MKRYLLTFLLLIISGFLLAQVEDDPSFTEYQDKVPGTLMVEFGLAYDSDYPPGMELNWWRSRTFNLYYMYDIRIFGSEKLSLNPGFGLGTDNYSFTNSIFVVKGEDSLSGQVVDMDASKLFTDKNGNPPEVKNTKINPIYLDIPIEIRFRTNSSKKSFRFAIGGKVGIRVDSKTKIKYKSEGITSKVKIKNDLHIEQFRYGVYVRFGYGSFNFWVYKALSGLFVDPSTDYIQGNYSPWIYGITLVTF
jgi:Outer membrane protein beta-barrel domain